MEQANAGSPGTAEATDRVTDCGWVLGVFTQYMAGGGGGYIHGNRLFEPWMCFTPYNVACTLCEKKYS